MRYKSTENTVLAGQLPPSTSVTIKIINMETDELIELNDSVCVESIHIPGVYLFNTSNITTQLDIYTNCLYEMSGLDNKGALKKFYGKIVIGGLFNNIEYNDSDLKALAYAILGSV